MALNVRFLKGTAAQYNALATKDANTFYYLSDDNKVYLGTIELSNTNLGNLIGDLTNLNTTNKETVVGAINEVLANEGVLANLTTEQKTNLVEAINEIDAHTDTNTTAIGNLSNLATTEKTNLVGAINEVKNGVVNTLTASNNGVEVGGSATAKTVGLKLSPKAGNNLSILDTTGEEGLYVSIPAATDYTVTVTESTPAGYAKAYTIAQAATGLSTTINIPKDMVVESGTVETKSEAGEWGQPGTYLHLVLANADESDIYINVTDLIEYVTSGSQAGDMVVVNIDSNHKVTATITDGTVTKAKLAQAVQNSLDAADSALQKADIAEGATDGTIAVKGTDVPVHGLKSAAYTESSAYDPAGSAAAAETAAKAYTDNALTWNAIA